MREHPEWFRWRDGELVTPILANPTDPRRPRVMSDLAELDLDSASARRWQMEYFVKLAGHYLELGATGLPLQLLPTRSRRTCGASSSPTLRERYPDAVFMAAALGCPFEQVRALAGCGFDLIFDSSRWWDFHDRWFLDQQEELRRIAPPWPSRKTTTRPASPPPSTSRSRTRSPGSTAPATSTRWPSAPAC